MLSLPCIGAYLISELILSNMRVNLFSLTLLLFLSGPTWAQQLVLTTEDYPPFNMLVSGGSEIVGISTEKVRELMRRAKEPYTIKLFPWNRAYQMGRSEPRTCVFSTTRTPEREPLFKWIGPLVKNNWVIFARKNDSRNPRSLDELRDYVLGVYRSDAVGEYLAHHGFKTDVANYDVDNPRKLLYQRFDFWATGELLGLAILKQQGLAEQIVPLFQFNQTEMYLACQPDMPLEKVEMLNRILREMEKDGSSAAIEQKYR